MTPEERKSAAEVMASDGPWEMMEKRRNPSQWRSADEDPAWNWRDFDYRVKPKPIVRYLNWYESSDLTAAHLTKKDAESNASMHRIACVRIEFLPGQFDE